MVSLRFLKWLLASAVAAIFLMGCGHKKNESGMSVDANTIRVGTMIGAEQQLLLAAKKIAAKKYDLTIEIFPYLYDYELNKALANKEIDANIFQYYSYLQASEKKYGYKLSAIGETYTYPMGVYSQKITNILQIKKGATIAIPEEQTNEARALFLLEKAGLIRMDSDENMSSTVANIVANPSGFKFQTFPLYKLGGVLPKVDLVVINSGFALLAGLVPSEHALVIENQNANYANMIVVREGEEQDPRAKALLELFRSPEVQKVANEIFHGQAIPAWQ